MKERVETALETMVAGIVASVSIANINALLTTVLLLGNISYLAWKWNRKRKERKHNEL